MSDDRSVETSAVRYKLRLFITGSKNLQGQYDLEIVDVYENPEATREQQIVATPTLVKILPEPLRKIIGDLSDRERVLAGLNILPMSKEP